MRPRSKIGRIVMWALILGGGYFAFKKAKMARALPRPGAGMSGAYPDSQGAAYPPGSGSTF